MGGQRTKTKAAVGALPYYVEYKTKNNMKENP